jgi:pyruvyl transferase EpsO
MTLDINNTDTPNNVGIEPNNKLIADTLKGLSNIIPSGRPIILFDYAVYQNVGDLLITRGIERFFELNGNKIIDQYSLINYRVSLNKKFPMDAVLVFQGGGNFGDLFSGHNKMRLEVVRKHSENEAVFLPQTLYYEDINNLEQDASNLASFDNLSICLRDKLSYDIGKSWFKNDIYLYPDTAHFLQDFFGVKESGNNTLNFLRVDQKKYSVTGIESIPSEGIIDWPSFLTGKESSTIAKYHALHRFDANYYHSGFPYAFWKLFRNKLLNRASSLFLDSSDVVTNRLHGLIFGVITRRDTKIIETGYGKVSAYYETWLKDFSQVSLSTPDVHKKGMSKMLKSDK